MILTENQKRHVDDLRRVGATSRERSVPAVTDEARLSPMVLGRLRDRGLVESRVRVRNKRQWTEYWLTDKAAEVKG